MVSIINDGEIFALPSNEFHKRSSTTISCRHFVFDTQR